MDIRGLKGKGKSKGKGWKEKGMKGMYKDKSTGKGNGKSKGMKGKRKGKGMKGKEKGRRQGCFICGSNSHWSKECPQAKNVNALMRE